MRRLQVAVLLLSLAWQPAFAASEESLTQDGVTAWLSTNSRPSATGGCEGTTIVSTSAVGPEVLAVTVTTAVSEDCAQVIHGIEVVRDVVDPGDVTIPASEPREGSAKAGGSSYTNSGASRRTVTATAEEWLDEYQGSDTLIATVHATQTFGYDRSQAYHFSGATSCAISSGRFVQDGCAGQLENQGPGYAQYKGTLWTHDARFDRFYHTISGRSIAHPDGYSRAECYHTGDWTAASYMKCRST